MNPWLNLAAAAFLTIGNVASAGEPEKPKGKLMSIPTVEKKSVTCANGFCGLPTDDAELRKLLTPEQYRVTKENGTERPFANAFWDNKKPGLYVDVISGEALFSSKEKFDSGTGWPSFWAPVENKSVVEIKDSSHGMVRVEVRSARSNSHLGHIFEDGPAPTGRRYCINSASLRFIPLADLDKEGYGKYQDLFKK